MANQKFLRKCRGHEEGTQNAWSVHRVYRGCAKGVWRCAKGMQIVYREACRGHGGPQRLCRECMEDEYAECAEAVGGLQRVHRDCI